MTALTVPVRPAEDASLRPLPWRRMAWVSWRHHRIALGGVAVFLGALAVWLWIAGLQLHHAYAAAARLSPGELGCLPEPDRDLPEHERHSERWLRPAARARADRGIRRGADAGS